MADVIKTLPAFWVMNRLIQINLSRMCLHGQRTPKIQFPSSPLLILLSFNPVPQGAKWPSIYSQSMLILSQNDPCSLLCTQYETWEPFWCHQCLWFVHPLVITGTNIPNATVLVEFHYKKFAYFPFGTTLPTPSFNLSETNVGTKCFMLRTTLAPSHNCPAKLKS